MMAVARGERKPPTDAGGVRYESAEAVMRVLTRDARALMNTIVVSKPTSISALAKAVGRATPNVHRSLERLEEVGVIKLVKEEGNRVRPVMTAEKIVISIDPTGRTKDRFVIERAGKGITSLKRGKGAKSLRLVGAKLAKGVKRVRAKAER
jgi:predicted transcriptional regulator